ncbi:uncharacterized protein UTRI_05406 [Ustilago trichophora]|uniref:Uncharacterized protein n=1 Tax=Ustilago trichophora TaxID=86804 RepID=A0A5C3EFY0_9BASI|nr:uncharacterized protein UTRI_05406 [Ustilago trichophora]
MSTNLAAPNPSVQAAQAPQAAQAAQAQLGKKWSHLVYYFDLYCQRAQADPDPQVKDDIREDMFAHIISRLDALTRDAAFYTVFANFSSLDQPFLSDVSINHLRPKLDQVASTWSPLTNQLQLSAWLQSLSLPPKPSPPRHSPTVEDVEVSLHFSQQFNRPLRGNAPLRFLKFVLDVQAHFDGSSNRDLYFKATPIVQSSGTGKTRMVLEVAKYAPLLYICLRSKGSRALHGFPESDSGLVNYFSTVLKTTRKTTPESFPTEQVPEPKYTCDLQVAAFLGAWFQQLALELADKPSPKAKHDHLLRFIRYGARSTSSSSTNANTNADANASLTMSGTSQTMQVRHDFFEKVCEAALSLLEHAPPLDASQNSESTFEYCLKTPMGALAVQLHQVRDYLWDHHISHDDKHFLLSGAKLSKPPILVAIDECVDLVQTFTGKVNTDHQLNSLRRAWNFINRHECNGTPGTPGFWLVLLSTNSAASILIEKSETRGSDRAKGMQTAPTFVALGFDVIRQEALPLRRAANVSERDHLQKYGRPLWTTLRPTSFWEDAKLKLLDSSDSYDVKCRKIDKLGGLPNIEAIQHLNYNILASRLALSFLPVKGQIHPDGVKHDKLATGSVDRHMRILGQVVDGYRLDIWSPSEPVLAIAAALVMMPFAENSSNQDVESLIKKRYRTIIEGFQQGCLPMLYAKDVLKGTIGEFVARLILMAAWDAAKLPLLSSVGPQARNQDAAQSQTAAAESSTQTAPISAPLPLNDQRTREFCSPLRLRDLLGNMSSLTPEYWNLVDQRIDWVRKRLAGLDVASNNNNNKNNNVDAWTNFTHFDLVNFNIQDISSQFLWYCWKRGVAIQTVHEQGGIDGIIPVFVGDLERDFGTDEMPAHPSEAVAARHMTFVSWQAKNREETTSTARLFETLRGPSLVAWKKGEQALTEKALLTIWMELGTESSIQQSTSSNKRAQVLPWPEDPVSEALAVPGGPVAKKRKRAPSMAESATREGGGGSSPSTSRKAASKTRTSPQREVSGKETVKEGKVPDSAVAPPSTVHVPSACQKGFVLVKLRGVRRPDVYPCLDSLDIRTVVVEIVAQLVSLKRAISRPAYEEGNRWNMPLDLGKRIHDPGYIDERSSFSDPVEEAEQAMDVD